jgi:rSAM/selenodomain-associated transferase 1
MQQRHVVVMAKAPRVGAVKARLARSLGPVRAWQVYRTMASFAVRRLVRPRRWVLWVALTPDGARPDPRWGRGFRVISQGPGDLGRRMARCFAQLPPGPAVMVGGDIPALSARHVEAAFRALGEREAVLGPAPDGGYWLVGLRRTPGQERAFNGVRWSGADALSDTARHLALRGRRQMPARIDMLEDVDDLSSFARWRRRSAPCLSVP